MTDLVTVRNEYGRPEPVLYMRYATLVYERGRLQLMPEDPDRDADLAAIEAELARYEAYVEATALVLSEEGYRVVPVTEGRWRAYKGEARLSIPGPQPASEEAAWTMLVSHIRPDPLKRRPA